MAEDFAKGVADARIYRQTFIMDLPKDCINLIRDFELARKVRNK